MGKDVLKLLAYADDLDLVLGTRTTRELILPRPPMWACSCGGATGSSASSCR